MRSSDEEMEEMRRAYDDVVTRYGLNADATGLGQAAALLKTVNPKLRRIRGLMRYLSSRNGVATRRIVDTRSH